MDTEELSLFLRSASCNDAYEVNRVLKESPYERTELVSLIGLYGESAGEYIRKTFSASSGLGSAYRTLYDAQRAGRRFLYLPRIEHCENQDDKLVVIMEKAPGVSLDQAVRDKGCQMGSETYLAWVSGVFAMLCDAVRELHRAFDPPLIHRDLKPENIILSSAGITIIDLGIARSYCVGAVSDTVKFGTRAYAPPEQFGYGQTDLRSDVYALGMVLLFMVTGKTPSSSFAGEGISTAGIDYRLARVVGRATSFNPEDRFANADELKNAASKAFSSMKIEKKRAPHVGWQDGLSRSVGEKLGVAWNILLLSVSLLLLFSCMLAAVDPSEYDAQFPLWFRLLEYGGFFGLAVASVSFALLDKRPLGRIMPVFDSRRWSSWLPLSLKMLAVAAFCFLLIVILAATMFSGALPADAL